MHIDDWQDNGDGTWTVKSEGATLWDIYGADWKEKSGYEGNPTNLRVGDTVGKKEVESILTPFDILSLSVDAITGIAEYKAKVPEFTKANEYSLPFPILKDPGLISKYDTLKSLSKCLLYIGLVIDIVDGIYAGIKYESFARGAYRTVTNLATTGISVLGSYGGALLGSFVEPVGGTIVGGILGGFAIGYGASWVSSKGEEFLFEEAKK